MPEDIRAGSAPADGIQKNKDATTIDDLEKDHIYQVLRETGWNQSKASELLGIHRNTLRDKIKRFGLKEA